MMKWFVNEKKQATCFDEHEKRIMEALMPSDENHNPQVLIYQQFKTDDNAHHTSSAYLEMPGTKQEPMLFMPNPLI
jgi:hypothetical protein